MASRRLKDYSSADKIDVVVKLGLLYRMPDTGHCGKVDHGSGLFRVKYPLYKIRISDVALVKEESISSFKCFNIFPFDGWIVKMIKIIQADNGLLIINEPLAQVGPDKSGTTCYENSVTQ